jgi:hypothetical protein
LKLADLYDLVRERPRDDSSGAEDHTESEADSSPAVS